MLGLSHRCPAEAKEGYLGPGRRFMIPTNDARVMKHLMGFGALAV
jgi:hypothetical protein